MTKDEAVEVVYEPKRPVVGPGWSRRVLVGGEAYRCEVHPFRRIRIPYSHGYGYHWHGSVKRESDWRRMYAGQVDKDISPCTMLRAAGVIAEDAKVKRRILRQKPDEPDGHDQG